LAVPPEVLFHRYFQEIAPLRRSVRPEDSDPRPYKGKLNLDTLPDPAFRALLLRIQQGWNEALRNERRDIPGYVNHPAFHVDYIDSSLPNAIAFRYENYSFIGITIALLNSLGDVCVRLGQSEPVATAVGVRLPPEEHGALEIVFFQILSSFVIVHEYTHHVFGQDVSIFFHEIWEAGEGGSLRQQAPEVEADGYATRMVFANLLDAATRSALTILGIDTQPTDIQDHVLLSSFVVAVGAYFFIRPAPALDNVTIYRRTHPPQAARMNCLMHHVISWCESNRPGLEHWMSHDRYQKPDERCGNRSLRDQRRLRLGDADCVSANRRWRRMLQEAA
jgi:hypothetical protein